MNSNFITSAPLIGSYKNGNYTVQIYADGTKVYVNYDYVDVTFEGKTIPARDYLVEK